ncbi:MAG: dihydrofolate reductase family protein [Solirubrobacteraceae bacterium]|nr:dihydrofolate reductase family protein [Solirubrobacteraceae bacterium]
MTSAPPSKSQLTRIYPPGREVPVVGSRAAYSELEFGAGATEERPYVIVNMVTTADGQGRIGANTEALGGDGDADLFATLRERVDCVVAGVGTIGAEHYNAPARTPDVQERRVAAGLAPRPIVGSITRSGELPTGAPIFADAGIRIVVASEAELKEDEVSAQLERVPTNDPAAYLGVLRHEYGVRSVLLEGGPHLNTPFFAEELVDELFLTVAPVLTGNDNPFPIIAGKLPSTQKLHLIGALAGDEHLFLRYRVD